MAYKIKFKKLKKNEYLFYQKGYWDASMGNKNAYSKRDVKKQ